MEIRAAMVEYALGRRGHNARLLGNPDIAIVRARPHSANAREMGTLYLTTGETAVANPPANAGFAILRLEDAAGAAPSDQSTPIPESIR